MVLAPRRAEDFVLVLVDPLDEAAVALDQVRLLALLLLRGFVLAEVSQPRSLAAALQLRLALRTAGLQGTERGRERDQ